jgi:hypothetical protein
MLAFAQGLIPRRASDASYTAVTPVAPQLGRAFVAAADRDTPEETASLYWATLAFVRRLKAAGLPPERVVVALKDAISKYGGHGIPSLIDDSFDAQSSQRALAYRRAFAWCLDAYFENE